MADELKQPPFPFELMPSLKEKEEEEEKPFPFELMPSLSVPTSTSFGRSLGLTPIEEVLPEEPVTLPEPELATSPEIAEVETEVEQGNIFKLRDETDEVSNQFQALQAEQVEAEAMQLPTEKIRKARAEKLKEWNKKKAELQARRLAFKEKTGFTPDEYGRSEREVFLLRLGKVDREAAALKARMDAGTTGPVPEPNLFEKIRDTDTASLIFGPSKRTEGDWHPLAREGSYAKEGVFPWKKGLDEAFWEAYDSGPKDRNRGLKLLSGVMGAVFEGTPKTPFHKPLQAAKKQIDKSVVEVDKAYGKDSWQAKSWGAYAGVTTTIVDFADIMVGNTGGLGTLGAGSVLGKVAQTAKGTAVGTAASTTTAATEAAFATHILDGIHQSLPQVLDTWYDPNASTKEKAEAVSGAALAAYFAVKLGHGSAKNLEGALKSQYGIDINLQTATRAELNNAGVRMVRVRENKAAKAEGREPITPKEGETLMEYATRVAAEKVKVVEGKILPKLKGEKQKTFNRIVGELQALERMRLDEPRIDKETGKEVREGIPVEETTIVEPILGERPVRPEVPVEEAPAIVIPPEPIPEAGSLDAYYGKEKPTLQVRPDPEAALLEAAARDAKMDAALKEEPAAAEGLNWGSRKDAIYEPAVWEGKKLVKESVEIEPEAVGLVPNQGKRSKPYYWTVKLTPSQFESLNPRGGKPETVEYIKSLAEKGADIAPPFVEVEWNAKRGAWQVTGHEGRSRTKAYKELVGDEPMTVDLLLGGGLRRGDLTPEMKSGKLMPDKRAEGNEPVTPMEWIPKEPAKPAAKAAEKVVVEDAKVEGAAEKVVDAEAKLAEAVAVGAETVEVKRRMKELVKKEIAFLRREGATAEDIAIARELELDPTSFYDILPSSRWADMISRLSKAEVEAMEATEGIPSNVKSMTDGRKVQLNYEAYKAAEKSGNPDAPALKEEYTKSLQEWASDATELGQRIESLKHNPHITPEILVDKINQTLKDSVGGKEIEGKERTELEGLVEKSMDAIKEFKEAQDKHRREPTEENFNDAFEKLQKSEAASRDQWEFMTNHSPKLWADLYVSALQGNLLTPATLVLNVGGNIVPLLLRAPSRATTRALDLMHEFYTGKPARRAELKKLREEFEAMADKESPEYADIAAEIARREKEIISDTIIQPARGTLAKVKGLTKGMGLERIREALKAPKGEKWQAFKHRRYDDAISSLLFGQRANMYEAGVETVMSPLSPWRAWKRIGRQISSKEGKQGAEKTLKDLAEGTLGVAPNLMFRALAAGDLPFRHAEFARLVENYGTRLGRSKGWGRDKTDTWIERATKAPEIVFSEKMLLELRNEANRATFQNENLATKYLAKLNNYLRAPKTGGLEGGVKRTLYAGYRSTVPYQKTLVNIVGEYLSYTPLGVVDVALNPTYGKGWTVQKKMATARVLTGLGAYFGVNAIRKMTGTDIISVDYSMGMEDEKRSVAYLSPEVVPHGTINWNALGRFLEGESTAYQKGDRVTNLQKAGPLGDIMLAVSSFQDMLEKMPASEREAFSENIGNLMLGVGEQKFRFALNQSFAQNARDFVQGLIRTKSPSELFKPWARGAAAVAIPNTLDWFYNNSKDNPWRRNYRSDTFTDELKLSWKKKMIAWDWINNKGEWSEKAGEQNPVIFNLWGEPVERIRRGGMLLGIKKVNPDSSFERYLHSSFGVFETGQIIPTAESSEIWRLWRDTRNSDIAPSIPRRKISRDEEDYELNRDQYAVYQRLIGLRRIKGPPQEGRWQLSGKLEHFKSPKWAGMTALLKEGNSYEGGDTAWVDMKQDEQVRQVLKMYSGARRSAGDYLVDNFMLKKGGPTKEDLIALAGLGEDATEKEARAVIKSFSINLDNLDKLEVTEKPSGRLKK
jgi:hypothetical protein